MTPSTLICAAAGADSADSSASIRRSEGASGASMAATVDRVVRRPAHLSHARPWRTLAQVMQTFGTRASARAGIAGQRLGRSMVPVQCLAPQRQAQIFFSRGVWRSARVIP